MTGRRHLLKLARHLDLAKLSHFHICLEALLEKRRKRGRLKLCERVANNRDLLKWTEAAELQPRMIAQHGRFHFMKRHQLEASLQIARVERLLGHKEPQRDHPFRRRRRMKERKSDLRLIDAVDSHHPAL